MKPNLGISNRRESSFVSKGNVSVNRSIHKDKSRDEFGSNKSRDISKSRGQLLQNKKRTIIKKSNKEDELDKNPETTDTNKKFLEQIHNKKVENEEIEEKVKNEIPKIEKSENNIFTEPVKISPSEDEDEILQNKMADTPELERSLAEKQVLKNKQELEPIEESLVNLTPANNKQIEENDIETKEKPIQSKPVIKKKIERNMMKENLFLMSLNLIIENQKKKIQLLEEDNKKLEQNINNKDHTIRDLEDKKEDLEMFGKIQTYDTQTADNHDFSKVDNKLNKMEAFLDDIDDDFEKKRKIDFIIQNKKKYFDMTNEKPQKIHQLKQGISEINSIFKGIE